MTVIVASLCLSLPIYQFGLKSCYRDLEKNIFGVLGLGIVDDTPCFNLLCLFADYLIKVVLQLGMALVDDPEWLLSHIQHSFITSDDTGMCEMVIQPNDLYTLDEHRERLRRQAEADKVADEKEMQLRSSGAGTSSVPNETVRKEVIRAPSPDILSGWDFGVRRRSNTAQKLERIRKERQSRIKIKTVHWKQMPQRFVNEHLDTMFEKKEIVKQTTNSEVPEVIQSSETKSSHEHVDPNQTDSTNIVTKTDGLQLSKFTETDTPVTTTVVAAFKGFSVSADTDANVSSQKRSTSKKSALSKLLEKSVEPARNPFKDYAKFDGHGHEGTAITQRINMFVYVYGEPAPKFSISVVVLIAGAKIHDLIGLTCYKYCTEKMKPELKRVDVQGYGLHIAEDDGEVDYGFPPLDSNEPVSKFSFPTLALVEKHQIGDGAEEDGKFRESVFVKVYDHTGFSLIQIEDLKITMGDILKKAVKRRKGNRYSGSYRLEYFDRPGIVVDSDQSLDSTGVMEFCMVREHSVRSRHNYPSEEQHQRRKLDFRSSHSEKTVQFSDMPSFS